MKIAMVAPRREACGVSDYTKGLVRELSDIVEVVHFVDPVGFRAEMNDDVDVVHVQHEYFVFGGVAPWKCRFRSFVRSIRRPLVMTIHEIVPPHGSAAHRAAIRLSNRLHFLHPAVQRYIVHTAQDKGRLAAVGAAEDRIHIIRLGVPEPPSMPTPNEAKRILGLDNQFVITIYGFISRKKGHLIALDGLRNLPQDVMLVIAGGKHPDDSTGYVDRVTEGAREHGVRARITGYMPSTDVFTNMAAADLVLAPFIESSGSASLALAFACGKPILASDIRPHREIVGESPNSMLLFGKTPDDLSRVIGDLRANPALLRTLSEGARSYADAHSVRKMAELTAQLYSRVVSEKPR